MKVITAVLLLLTFTLTASAQDDQEWIRHTSVSNVLRFEYPASWELEENDRYVSPVLYSHSSLSGPDDITISIEVDDFNFSQWSEFNVPRNSDFETIIAEAIRWRWAGYTLIDLGDRQFVQHSETRGNRFILYLTTLLDTGIFGSITAVGSSSNADEMTEIAQTIASSLEYAGDFPVDLSCVPLSSFVRFVVEGGTVTMARATTWETSSIFPPDFSAEGFTGIYGSIDTEAGHLIAEQDCFGVPDISFELRVLQAPITASASDLETRFIEELQEVDFFISAESVTLLGEPGAIINWGEADIIFSQIYVGTLENGDPFIFDFSSLPGQTERWQELALAIIESITFEPA